jgi:sugar lactone lactonase YvrE
VRPLQLAWDGRALVVLSVGTHGDAAGEIVRLPADADGPRDLSREPVTRIPFRDGAATTLGSLAVDPATGALFLGEENGTRLWRLAADGGLALYATGLHRLAGGSTLAFDREGRLLVLDYADPLVTRSPESVPRGLEHFRDDDYRGPLVLRLVITGSIPLPRRLQHLPPLFPRAWGGESGGRLLPHLISVASHPRGDVILLSSAAELYRLGPDNRLAPFARLPRGQYHRTNMVVADDGTVYVSGGFHLGQVFRISTAGTITMVASDLADPAGIAVDRRGTLYIAESSRHRILRVR